MKIDKNILSLLGQETKQELEKEEVKKPKKKKEVIFTDGSDDPLQDFSLEAFIPSLEIPPETWQKIPEKVTEKRVVISESEEAKEQKKRVAELKAEYEKVKRDEKVKEHVIKEVQKDLIKESLEAFLLYDNPTYDAQPFHRVIIEKFQEAVNIGGKRIIISMPPRHGKSEIISKKGIAWALAKNPEKEIVLVTYGQTLSDDFSRIARGTLIEHQDMLGVEISKESASVSRWGLEGYKGSVTATGALGAITGRGASLLVIDDVVKSTVDANNPSAMSKLWDNYRAVFRTRLAPNASIIVVATRWTQDDLIGRLLKEAEEGEGSDKWEYICFPCECVNPTTDYLGRKRGTFLWEDRFSKAEYNSIKNSLGSALWSSLYQQNPMVVGGNLIKREWIRHYERDELQSGHIRTYVSVDTAFKGGLDSDFSVIQFWGDMGGCYYLIEQIREKLSFTECLGQLDIFIEDCTRRYKKPSAILIEDKANGTAIINVLKRKYNNIIPVNPTESKKARLISVAPLFEAGSVKVPKSADFIADFINELTGFPSTKHDDIVDATSQFLNYVSARVGSNTTINIRGILRI